MKQAIKIFSSGLLISSLFFISLPLALANTIVANGIYYPNSGLPQQQRLAFLTSENDGLNWSFVADQQIEFPASLHHLILSHPSCSGNICLLTVKDNGQSALLISQNHGYSWSYVKEQLGKHNELLASSCVNDFCVTVGEHRTRTSYTPLIITSHDRGTSWTVIKNIVDLPESTTYKFISLEDVSCTAQSCVAAGHYYPKNVDPKVMRPVFISSQDGGQSWSFVDNINGYDNQKRAFINQLTCTKDNCLAVGINGTLIGTHTPLMLIGGGDSNLPWSVVKLPELKNTEQGFLSSVTCVNKNCIAVGYLTDSNDKKVSPLLLFSDDQGQHWQVSEAIFGYPSTPIAATDYVSCTNNLCVATGRNYITGSGKICDPFIIVSKDYGHTWSYVNNITGLPKEPMITTLGPSYCQGKICTIVGHYGNSDNQAVTQILLLVSNDQGQSWSKIDNNTILNRPPGFGAGYLESILAS